MEMHGGPAPAAKAVWLDRTTPPHVVTLVLMTGVGALNINMVLPSLPSIAAHYDAATASPRWRSRPISA